MFNFPWDLARQRDQAILRRYVMKLFIICNPLSSLVIIVFWGSGDITYLICHKTLQQHLITGSCSFMTQSSSFLIGLVELILIFHVSLRKHLIKGSCDFTEKSSFLHVTTLPSLVAKVIVPVELQRIQFVTWPCTITRLKSLLLSWKEAPHCMRIVVVEM